MQISRNQTVFKKKVTWSQKSLSKSVNWSKCSTLSPEEYYFKDTIKRLSESDFIANTSKFFKYYASLTVYIHKIHCVFFQMSLWSRTWVKIQQIPYKLLNENSPNVAIPRVKTN